MRETLPSWYRRGYLDTAALKAKLRERRRALDRRLRRLALDGVEDLPTGTRNAELVDRWCHD